ncbi:MAG: glycosyltransferase [Candidatus Eisenbacteria bacterium]
MNPDYVIIVPARNEERTIGRLLDSLRGLGEEIGARGEIVVVDNGSEDRTAAIASAAGARIVLAPEGSIGRLRNLGVEASTAPVLCFLDADCEVTPKWRSALGRIVSERPSRLITGFPATEPPGAGTLERVLAFRPSALAASYIPSGNLVVMRDAFESVGGFDPRLATGEDHDFCRRALARGVRIEPRPELLAYHHGFPKSFAEYFRRERWHGRGDFQSWRCFLGSRPAQLGSVVLASLVACAALCAAGAPRPGALAGALGGAGPVLLTALARGDRSAVRFPLFLAKSAVYLLARGTAAFDVLLRIDGRGLKTSG